MIRKKVSIGDTYGTLKVVERKEKTNRGWCWLCVCDCGNSCVKLSAKLHEKICCPPCAFKRRGQERRAKVPNWTKVNIPSPQGARTIQFDEDGQAWFVFHHKTRGISKARAVEKTCGACGAKVYKQKSTKARKHYCNSCYKSGVSRANWKGGEYTKKDGYVMKLCPSHPRATHDGYVRKHILVMEESLKRPLYPKETVHHKNGMRGDNDINNLQLRNGFHPQGTEIEHIVPWAKEILRRYEPEALSEKERVAA
jgi:hypothetical protein